MEFDIRFCLRSDDPAYNEERDNFLTRLTYDASVDFETGYNWCDYADEENKPYHCLIFHELSSYSRARPRLTERDLLRIGYIYVDINLQYQRRVEILPIKTVT